MASLKDLTDPQLAIIFATSPTGLGHLRVTDAFYHGLPKETSPILLGAQDPSVSAMYRFVSIHPFTRRIMELVELPPLNKPFAKVGRMFIRSQTTLLYQQLKTILSERLTVPKKVLLVATHTTLGHQLGAIKKKLEKEMGITIVLVIQVTDDSPQPIWYVYDADALFVPSEYTKKRLLDYAKSVHLPIIPVIVSAYPISPQFSERLSEKAWKERLVQTDSSTSEQIHISLPISGAAVGTSFSAKYITEMHQLSDRFFFHVTSREAAYTDSLIQSLSQMSYVKLYTSPFDMKTVDNYEKVFAETMLAFEVTKPSEQAFKTLATPKERGGVIMLFTHPVGGQEYDNLHFLRNHGLMPSQHNNRILWQLARTNEPIPEELLQKAHHWRALRLPTDHYQAAMFTFWGLNRNLFSAMMHYERAQHSIELQSNGVEQFWQHTLKLLGEK
jgi:hypothetical protein